MACSRKTCWRYASIATLDISDLVQLMYVPLETLMQMLLQLLDILSYYVHYCINLAISDSSSFIDVEHLISPKNSFFTQYIFQEVDICGIIHSSSKSSDRLFSQHCFTPRKLPCFFPNVQSLHFRGTIRVFGRSLGGVLGPSFRVRSLTESRFLMVEMFDDVHKFQIGQSVCKFDKLKIMFY